jgi:hypothetical protein
MRLINYTVVMKKIKLKANLMKFTWFNYMIIGLAFFNGILCLFQSFGSLVFEFAYLYMGNEQF